MFLLRNYYIVLYHTIQFTFIDVHFLINYRRPKIVVLLVDGETSFQTDSSLWTLGYEGEAGDRRIWSCLSVSASGDNF